MIFVHMNKQLYKLCYGNDDDNINENYYDKNEKNIFCSLWDTQKLKKKLLSTTTR